MQVLPYTDVHQGHQAALLQQVTLLLRQYFYNIQQQNPTFLQMTLPRGRESTIDVSIDCTLDVSILLHGHAAGPSTTVTEVRLRHR